MADETRTGNETFPALGAFEGLLPRVSPLVGDEGGLLPEALAAT